MWAERVCRQVTERGLLPCSWKNGSPMHPAVKVVRTLDRCQSSCPLPPPRRQKRGFSGVSRRTPQQASSGTAQQPAAQTRESSNTSAPSDTSPQKSAERSTREKATGTLGTSGSDHTARMTSRRACDEPQLSRVTLSPRQNQLALCRQPHQVWPSSSLPQYSRASVPRRPPAPSPAPSSVTPARSHLSNGDPMLPVLCVYWL